MTVLYHGCCLIWNAAAMYVLKPNRGTLSLAVLSSSRPQPCQLFASTKELSCRDGKPLRQENEKAKGAREMKSSPRIWELSGRRQVISRCIRWLFILQKHTFYGYGHIRRVYVRVSKKSHPSARRCLSRSSFNSFSAHIYNSRSRKGRTKRDGIRVEKVCYFP